MSPAASVTVDRSTAVTACVASTFGFQPAMVPSSVANRKTLDPDAPPLETVKVVSGVKVLNVVPSGDPTAPAPDDGAAGMVTTVGVPGGCGNGLPAPS